MFSDSVSSDSRENLVLAKRKIILRIYFHNQISGVADGSSRSVRVLFVRRGYRVPSYAGIEATERHGGRKRARDE